VWKEQHLYGSSRLGVWSPDINVSSTPGYTAWPYLGLRQYELTNHLGNVLATISDKKLAHDDGTGGVDYYDAELSSATEYYSFGWQKPGRNDVYNDYGKYRFGFNGKENDDDVKGEGNQQDYGMRIYDPRVGRFLSVDPITNKYPELTPYQFASNTPIQAIDLDGTEGEYSMDSENEKLKRQGQTMLKKMDYRNNPLARYQSVQSTLSTSTPPKNEEERIKQEETNKREFDKVGRNPDGSKKPLTKLAESKTWNSFADNLALPLLEEMTWELRGSPLLKGGSLLLRSA
jgi:RHS repeat-associated protein